MDLRQLRYFVGICDVGSITAASKSLHVAQPALSNHVANLEAELNTKLLHRSSSGIVPTDQGEILYTAARRVLREVDQIPNEVSSVEGSPGGRAVIGISDGPSNIIGARFIENMLQRYPKIAIQYVDGHSSELHRKLIKGSVDAALFIKDPELGGVNHQPIMRENLFVATQYDPDFEIHNKPISIKELRKLPFIFSYIQGRSIVNFFDEQLRKVRFTPRVICEIESISVIKELIAGGRACTLTTWSMVYKEVAAKRISIKPIEDLSLEYCLELCTAIERPPSAAVSAAIKVLLDTIIERCESRDGRGFAKLLL